MKFNTQEVAVLQPDYLGFIFYGKSKRDFEGMEIPDLPVGIKKVGVFVDAELAFAKAQIEKYKLDIVQLHGDESPAYVNALRLRSELGKPDEDPDPSRKVEVPALSGVEVWKVFGIKDTFDFNRLKPYEGIVNAFLFDTKGKEKGGNGYTFNWEVLMNYTSKTPMILSGGIGLDEIEKIKDILATDLPIIALDVNSKFEKEPGMKDIKNLEKFKQAMAEITPLRS
ncbi:phosphoribosylanthranilate isomerase [Dokdonia sinensis]|nr:phosphoribosylanthranilate isomerase [Dokdonia sinensis]